MKLIGIKNFMKVSSLALSAGFVLSGCGGKDADPAAGGTNDVTLSGSLALTSKAFTAQSVGGKIFKPAAIALSDLTMACVTLSVPPIAGSGAIDSAGAFSVSMVGGSGKKFGCFILDSLSEVLGSLVFEDTAKKGIDGSSKKDTGIALTGGSTSLGAITLNLETGEAVVPVANITTKDTTTGASAVTDITGTWVFSNYADRPASYEGVCAQNDQDCDGPPEGWTAYLRMVTGVEPGTSRPAYGLMMWESLAAFQACGSNLGTTYAELAANGVDFTNSGTAEGDHTWATTVTIDNSSQTVTDGWKLSGATAQWTIQTGCDSFEFRGQRVWRCLAGGVYSFSLGGGCVDANDNPVMVNDWSNISTCTNYTPEAPFTDFSGNRCTGTANSVAVTCSHADAKSVNADGSTINNALNFDYSQVAQIAQGTSCSGISDPLAQAKCYSEYYWRKLGGGPNGGSSSACLKQIQTNWDASTVAEFITVDDKPNSLQIANFADVSGGTITVLDEKEDYRGVQAGNNWVNCKFKSKGVFSATVVSATELLGTYADQMALVDLDKPACVAFMKDQGAEENAAGGWQMAKQYMFTLDKQ